MLPVALSLGMPACGVGGFYITAKVDQKFDPRHRALQSKHGTICLDKEDLPLHRRAFRNEDECERFARFCSNMVKGLGYGLNLMGSTMLPYGVAGLKLEGTETPYMLLSLGGLSLGCMLITVSNCLMKMGTKTANAYLESPEGQWEEALHHFQKSWPQTRQVRQLED